jgi:peptide/nickel transport system substrate-binding protein
MYTTSGGVDPERNMLRFASWEAAAKANKWSGINISRWRNDDYDRAFRQAERELDPVKRAALFIQMNDMLVRQFATLPLIHRKNTAAVSSRLHAPVSPWTSDLAFLRDWYRDA